MQQKRRAYEWSIIWFSMDKDGNYEDSDPEFADKLKYLLRQFGKDIPFVKESDEIALAEGVLEVLNDTIKDLAK